MKGWRLSGRLFQSLVWKRCVKRFPPTRKIRRNWRFECYNKEIWIGPSKLIGTSLICRDSRRTPLFLNLSLERNKRNANCANMQPLSGVLLEPLIRRKIDSKVNLLVGNSRRFAVRIRANASIINRQSQDYNLLTYLSCNRENCSVHPPYTNVDF